MESDPEFPIPSSRLRIKTLQEYEGNQREFMPENQEVFMEDLRMMRIRKYGLRIISNYSKGESERLNAFIPYNAMNYFDRFISRHPLPRKERDDKENVRLLAVCCLTISWKMWTKSFSVQQFLTDYFVGFSVPKIQEVELCILNGLDWRMRSITPFHFLNYFYYPKFKDFGGFKRRCIHEVIVQSLCDPCIALYTPTIVAYSSLAAASDFAYEEAAKDLHFRCWSRKLMEDAVECRLRLYHVIKDNIIQIEKGETETEKDMARNKAISSEDIASSSNKGINLRTTMSDSAFDIPAERENRKKMWDFEVKWLTEDEEDDDDLNNVEWNTRCNIM